MGRVRSSRRGLCLKPSTYEGYKRVNLSIGRGKYKTFGVHRLVAFAFVDGYAEDLEVNHIDEDRSNNISTNLEWITHAKNIVYGNFTPRRMATLHKIGRVRNVIQKDIEGKIIARYSSVKEASAKSGVPYMTIANILKRGVRWRKDFLWEYFE
jgi:hypothetical protein